MILTLSEIKKNSKERHYGTIYDFDGINTNFRGKFLHRGLNENVTLGQTQSGNMKIVYIHKPDDKLYILAPLMNDKNSNDLVILGYEHNGETNGVLTSAYTLSVDWYDIHSRPVFSRNKILQYEFDRVCLYNPERDTIFIVDKDANYRQYTLDEIAVSSDPIFDHIIISDDKTKFADKPLTKYDPMFHKANVEYFMNDGKLIVPQHFDNEQRDELSTILISLPEEQVKSLLKDREGSENAWSVDKLNGYGILAHLGNLNIVNYNENLFPTKEDLKGMFALNPYSSVGKEKAEQVCTFMCLNKDNVIDFCNNVGFYDDAAKNARTYMLRALANPKSLRVIKNSKAVQGDIRYILRGIAENALELTRVDFSRLYGGYNSDYDHKGDFYDIYFAANEIDPKTCSDDLITRYLSLNIYWPSNEIYPDVKERVEEKGIPYWTEKLLDFSEKNGGLYNIHYNRSKQTYDLIANDLYDKTRITYSKEDLYQILDESVRRGTNLYGYETASMYMKDDDSTEVSLSKGRSLLLYKLDDIELDGAENYRKHQQSLVVPIGHTVAKESRDRMSHFPVLTDKPSLLDAVKF